MSQTNTNHVSSPGPNKSGTIASIVRDTYSSASNNTNNNTHQRDFHSDKTTLITSLNYNLSHLNNNNSNNTNTNNNHSTNHHQSNGQNGTSNNGIHTYQNISQFKQIQNLLQSTLNGGSGSGGGTNVNGNHSHGSPQQVPKVNAPPVPPPPPHGLNGLISSSVKLTQAPVILSNTTGNGHVINLNSTTTNGSSNGVQALSKSKTLDGYVGFANLPNQVII